VLSANEQETNVTPHDLTHCSLPADRSRAALFFGALALAAQMAMTPLAHAAEQRAQAVAQNPRVTVEGFRLQRKDFLFGNHTAWLKRDGGWHVEGLVRHGGLLCGTYEVGMRFGVGNPDCTDVRWVSEVRYATSQSQCNESEMQHSGDDSDAALTEQFDAITCAERVIRCSGNCK
jgi:hypothetical protein